MPKLICESHVKEFIKQKVKSMRQGWDCTAVSQDALDIIEAKVRAMIIKCVKAHPTKGKTFKEIL